jgi:ribonucleotide reductase alpha subunit
MNAIYVDVYGENLKHFILHNEAAEKKKTIKARELWEKILESQIETGTITCCIKMQQTVNQIST